MKALLERWMAFAMFGVLSTLAGEMSLLVGVHWLLVPSTLVGCGALYAVDVRATSWRTWLAGWCWVLWLALALVGGYGWQSAIPLVGVGTTFAAWWLVQRGWSATDGRLVRFARQVVFRIGPGLAAGMLLVGAAPAVSQSSVLLSVLTWGSAAVVVFVAWLLGGAFKLRRAAGG
jgi:hypothetical protein